MDAIKKHKKNSVERISQMTLYGIIAISLLVFVAFYLIGYDTPFVGDTSFNAPLLTDGVLWLMYFLVAGTLGVMVYSIIKTVRTVKLENKIVNGIPARKIGYGVFLGTLILVVVTFLLGSTSNVQINGIIFSDRFWLKITDMFINTVLVLLIVSIAAVIFGATRYHRGKRMGK